MTLDARVTHRKSWRTLRSRPGVQIARYLFLVPLVLVGAASACEGESVTKGGSNGDSQKGGNATTGGRAPSGGDAGRGTGGGSARGGSAGSDAGGEDSGGSDDLGGMPGTGGTAGPGGQAGAGGSDGSDDCDCSHLIGVDPRGRSPCMDGECVLDPSNCLEAYASCDGLGENGCETNIASDRSHCGRCGNVCATNERCEQFVCTRTCEPGLALCNDDAVCDPLDTDTSCGACGHAACAFQNTFPTCSAGTTCLPPLCRAGYANCGGDHACETVITTSSGSCYPALLTNTVVEASVAAIHVAVGRDGATIVAGHFVGEADFDPTSGVDMHVATGWDGTAFVSKYLPNGVYAWTKIFDGGDSSVGRVAVTDDGSVVVAGAHMNATDFDPGPASSIHETEQMQAYVVKLRADGSLAWVRTFIGVSEDGYTYGTDVALDANGAIYATGVFGGSVDFDPVGAGGELTTEPSSDFPANRSEKMYLVKLAAGGTFEWVRTHTGGGSSFGSGVSVSGERVWLGGSVGGSCRFDASVPETPSNTAATFISSSSASGAFGGYGLINNNVNGGRVASTASSVYLTSWLDREADLDPSSGTDQRTLPLSGPVAVKLDRDGAFVWSQTFSRFAGYAVDTAVTGLDGLLLPAAGPWLDFSSSSDSQRGVVFLVNADSSPGFTLDLGAEALPRSVALGSGLLAVAGQLETPLAAYGPPSFFVARYAYAN